MKTGKNDSRVHDKCYDEVGADEYAQKLYITDECSKTCGADGFSDKAHDAERCEVDDPGNHFRNSCCNIIEAGLCRAASHALQRNAENDSPCKNADVVCIHERCDRVIDNGQDQVVKDLDDAAWRSQLRVRSDLERQRGREEEGHCNAYERRTECTNDVQHNDWLHASFCIFLTLCHGVHDKEENENRSDAL